MQPVICNSDAKQPVFPIPCPDGYWAVPVADLSEVIKPDRDHAYILPDNSVWILNYEGTGMIQLNAGGTGGQATMIKNDDGYLIVTGSGTHDVTIDVNYDELMSDFYTKNETDDRIFEAVVGESLSVSEKLDFKEKTAGIVVENPSIAKMQGSPTLLKPDASTLYEFTQSRYDGIKELNDGKTYNVTNITSGNMLQVVFGFDVIGYLERKYPKLFKIFGATTITEKVGVAISKIGSATYTVDGSAKGVNSTALTTAPYSKTQNDWGGKTVTYGAEIISNSRTFPASNIQYIIQADGFVYVIAYAPPSDGTTASALNIDYVNLEFTLTAAATDIYALKSETYTKTELDSKLSLKADISKAQMSKITTDAGGALSTIGSGASLFDWIVAQGLGYRTIIVSSAASDIPKISSTFRGIVQNVSSNATGNVKLISDTGRYFIRSFYQGAWSSGWTELTGSGSSSNYWAFFNSAYTSLTVGATGDKTDRVVSIAGTDYSDGVYDSQSDTTSWSIPFALDSTSLLSYLIVYSDSTKTKQEFVYSLNTDINMNELKSTSLTILGRKGIDVTKVADNNYLLQLQQKGIYTTNNTFSLMFSQLGNINQVRLNILSTLLMEGASGPITFKEVVSSINYNPVSIYPVQFFVEAAARNFSTGSKYENYTLTGYYQLEKDSTDDKYYFELVIDGMYTYDFEIPYLSASRVSDPNNLLSESSTSTDEFVFRPKTVFI